MIEQLAAWNGQRSMRILMLCGWIMILSHGCRIKHLQKQVDELYAQEITCEILDKPGEK